ncbi:MAG: hypothetical protein QM697_16350 [Lachnospiraceae bacterium]
MSDLKTTSAKEKEHPGYPTNKKGTSADNPAKNIIPDEVPRKDGPGGE